MRELLWNISLVQILVEVAIIQMRTLKTEVEKGFLSTVIVQELAAPKGKLKCVNWGYDAAGNRDHSPLPERETG